MSAAANPPGGTTAEAVGSALGADGVVVFAADGQELTVADAWPADPVAASLLRIPVGFGVAGLVARSGRAALLAEDSPRNAVHRRLLGLAPGQTIARMCLPAPGLEGVVAGVLAMHRSPDRPFTEADQQLATSYAEVLGLRLHAEQLWRAVHRHRSERDRLIEAAISAQEAERRRIAFDLHDGVTTALASMAMHLSSADLTVAGIGIAPTPPADLAARARRELSTVRDLADLAYAQTRAAISGLHSLVLDDLGLVAALESLAQAAGSADGPSIDVVVDASEEFELVPDHAAAALYRIAQEALANAVRHAEADRVVLSLRRVGDSVVLGCTDDGVGFDPSARSAERAGDGDGSQHFGLSSIAERCALIEASLRLESTPGRGTTVLVELPL
ncbi:GAF domain-containing sensor histidine kinase [Nocardioides sp.]|uniref:GAF domain-containing sensor histidine kinase n=1 Tax=Nocardioides sp. TaxID=35761 RepID=UPI0035279E75